MNRSRNRTVKLDQSLIAELESMPDRTRSGMAVDFTPEMDAYLLKFWAAKKHDDVIAWWRKHYGWGSKHSLSNRYKELTK